MIAPGYAQPSGNAGGSGGVGGGAARLSTSVRYALAVGLLAFGIADLAAVDLVLLPRYLAGTTRVRSPLPANLPATATPVAATPVALPAANPTVVEPPSRPPPAQTPPTEMAPVQAAPANLAALEFPHLLFARNTSWLSPGARQALSQLAVTLAEEPSRRVLISGHSDNSGPEEHNRALSLARAQRCSHWLEKRGTHPARIEIQGFGSTRPVDASRSPQAQVHNRRVEIVLR
jgi:outer membrane protein OmpA-like peptidoglycan-associated protein